MIVTIIIIIALLVFIALLMGLMHAAPRDNLDEQARASGRILKRRRPESA